MKRFGVIAVAVALLTEPAFAGWNKTIAAAQKKAKASKQLIFVDMFADWCGWCHRMEKEVFPTEHFQKETDDMVLLRLNTEDRGEGTKLAQQFSVSQLPTFLLLTPDLGLAGIIRGYAPAAEFAKMIREAEGKHRAFEKLVASEPTFAKDPKRRFDLAREFTMRMSFPQAEVRLKKLIAEPKIPVDIRDGSYYELAVAQVLQAKYDDATKTLSAFAKLQNSGEAFERSRVLQAEVYLRQNNTLAALKEYRSFKEKFPKSSLIPNVDMMLPQVERLAAQAR